MTGLPRDAIYRFRIDVFTPRTIPMVRLAEYMAELARVLGESAAVHFERLESGSTVLVHRVQREAVPKVRERVQSVRRGIASRDVLRSYRTINKLLKEDNGAAVLRESKRGTIIEFPGRNEVEERYPAVRQYGSVDGIVCRVGGIDRTVPVTLEIEGQPISAFGTSRPVAKELAKNLFEPIRVFGIGKWLRDQEGNWSLDDFKIESFQTLDDEPLSATLSKLRELAVDWNEASYAELDLIRHGPVTKKNGGH